MESLSGSPQNRVGGSRVVFSPGVWVRLSTKQTQSPRRGCEGRFSPGVCFYPSGLSPGKGADPRTVRRDTPCRRALKGSDPKNRE